MLVVITAWSMMLSVALEVVQNAEYYKQGVVKHGSRPLNLKFDIPIL
jgi:hypothetical protein